MDHACVHVLAGKLGSRFCGRAWLAKTQREKERWNRQTTLVGCFLSLPPQAVINSVLRGGDDRTHYSMTFVLSFNYYSLSVGGAANC